MHTRIAYLAASLLAVASFTSLPAAVHAASIGAADPLSVPANALETHEFRIQNARVPGLASARQNVTAWQVTQGTWNGQNLDGLFVVLVQSTPESGAIARQTNCYVSQEATLAQRAALVDAFLASNTQSITAQDVNMMRIEPAVISVEMDGQSVVLHLGLVA